MTQIIKPSAEEIETFKNSILCHFKNAATLCTLPILLTRSTYDETLETVREATKDKPKIMIFSSSRPVKRFPVFQQEMEELGRLLANTNGAYVYGNGNSGMMGIGASSFINTRSQTSREAHHILGVGTPNFHAVEEDYPGVIVFVARDLDLRERFMIDLCEGLITARGAIGTDAEEAKFISQDGYIYKTGRPIVFMNTRYEHPRDGLKGAFDHRKAHMQESIDLEMVTPKHLENVYFAEDPYRTVALMLERIPGLKWTGPEDQKPVLTDGMGIDKLNLEGLDGI